MTTDHSLTDRPRAELLAVLAQQDAPDPRRRMPFPAIVINARCPGCGVVWDYDEDGNGFGVWGADGVLWHSAECHVRRYRAVSQTVRLTVKAFLADTRPDDAERIGAFVNMLMTDVTSVLGLLSAPPGGGDGGSAE